MSCDVFFFNDTATTEIYTLSLHDALPICGVFEERVELCRKLFGGNGVDGTDALAILRRDRGDRGDTGEAEARSEEHTSELQSRQYLVCRLLLEKKNFYHH